jgi:hypothetical protein
MWGGGDSVREKEIFKRKGEQCAKGTKGMWKRKEGRGNPMSEEEKRGKKERIRENEKDVQCTQFKVYNIQ